MWSGWLLIFFFLFLFVLQTLLIAKEFTLFCVLLRAVSLVDGVGGGGKEGLMCLISILFASSLISLHLVLISLYCLIAKGNLQPPVPKDITVMCSPFLQSYFLVVSAVNHQVLTCIHYEGKNAYQKVKERSYFLRESNIFEASIPLFGGYAVKYRGEVLGLTCAPRSGGDSYLVPKLLSH